MGKNTPQAPQAPQRCRWKLAQGLAVKLSEAQLATVPPGALGWLLPGPPGGSRVVLFDGFPVALPAGDPVVAGGLEVVAPPEGGVVPPEGGLKESLRMLLGDPATVNVLKELLETDADLATHLVQALAPPEFASLFRAR